MPRDGNRVSVASAIEELVRLGIAEPTWKQAPYSYSTYARWEDSDSEDDEDGEGGEKAPRWLWWMEPITGRLPSCPHSGFDADWVNGGLFSDHCVTLAETNESDGIRVTQARAIFGNPYSVKGVDRETEAFVRALGMELFVIRNNPGLGFYHSNATACVFKEMRPMPYTTFKRTFRYFLLRKTTRPTTTEPARLKPGVLPATATQPTPIFFDILVVSSEESVRLGLDGETAEQAWAVAGMSEFIERDTFCLLWALYRKGRTLWQRARALFKARCLVYYWSELASRPDPCGNAPPAAIDAFVQEFHFIDP